MPTWLIVVLAVPAVLVLGGIVASQMRRRRTGAHFAKRLNEVDRALAEAVALDRGWQRSTLEAAVRGAWAEHRPDDPLTAIELIEVIDLPGTDNDRAVYRVVCERGGALVTLGRREDAWFGERLVDE